MNKSKIRFGIIGSGARGIGSFGKMLTERENRVELVALCDLNPVRMRWGEKFLKRKFNFYSDVRTMIEAEQLDAVVITSPDCCHEAHAVDALDCGVDVLIDKPLSTTVDGCRNIIAAAKKAQKVMMMGFNLRHHPVLCKVKELIQVGLVGEVFLIENREFYSGGRTYMSRWNRLYQKSGGLWNHKGSHDFDVFQWLLDFPKPVKVAAFANISALDMPHLPFELKSGVAVGPTCHQCAYLSICPDACNVKDIQTGQWSDDAAASDGYYRDLCMYNSDKDTHDNGIAIVEYDNGAKASHLECFVTSGNDRLYSIVGTKGQLEVSLANRQVIFKPRWGKEVVTYQLPPDDGSGHGGADPKLMDEFLNVISGDVPNHASAIHGMYSTAVAQAAELSRREERLVKIEELFQ